MAQGGGGWGRGRPWSPAWGRGGLGGGEPFGVSGPPPALRERKAVPLPLRGGGGDQWLSRRGGGGVGEGGLMALAQGGGGVGGAW